MDVHHVGYLVKNLQDAKDEFIKLGFTNEPVTRDTYRGIDICFMENNGYRVELISPYKEESVVSGIMKKCKNSPYHLCYVSEDFEADIEKFCCDGYVQIAEPCVAPAIGERRTVFMMNSNIGMIELLEKNVIK